MSVASNLAASWAAFKAAGMLTAATWTPAVGSAVASDVMVDRPTVEAADGALLTDLTARYRVADWSNVQEGDTVAIGATTYTVRQSLLIDDGATALAYLTER